MNAARPICHYFVDEAGDGTLFATRGKVIIGQPGCSNFFMVGLLDVADVGKLDADLRALRTELLADPFLRGLRQMDPARGQTALFFHASEDPVEVRREVFRVLLRHDLKFSAVVKCKWKVLSYVRQRNRVHTDYRYHPNELYDFTLRRLFAERLHRHQSYRIVFAIRGSRTRSDEFRQALETARERFAARRSIDASASLEVIPARPQNEAGLQAVDYFLWALQRVYERRDDPGSERYLRAIWSQVGIVVDMDDNRRTEYGEYYTKKRPLVAAVLQSVEGYRNE